MTRQELAYHYESLLNQTIGIENHPETLGVLNEILDDALAVLEPWEDKIQWLEMRLTLRNPDEDIPPAIKQVAQLVMLCTNAIELGGIKHQSFTIRQIMNAYRSLDAAEVKNKTTKATAAKNANVERVKGVLKAYWKANISPALKPAAAAAAARKLANMAILNPDDKMPGDRKLRDYVIEWQAESPSIK